MGSKHPTNMYFTFEEKKHWMSSSEAFLAKTSVTSPHKVFIIYYQTLNLITITISGWRNTESRSDSWSLIRGSEFMLNIEMKRFRDTLI